MKESMETNYQTETRVDRALETSLVREISHNMMLAPQADQSIDLWFGTRFG